MWKLMVNANWSRESSSACMSTEEFLPVRGALEPGGRGRILQGCREPEPLRRPERLRREPSVAGRVSGRRLYRGVTELHLRRAVASLSEGGCERDWKRFKLLFDKADWSVDSLGPGELSDPLAL